ncbi:sigma-54-dependent transcriptional regulator [Bythopirellula polymerisocia]|nr:sigma-54 dependent transcriptional regulator [Bythopirellula polymerisocia]
MDSKRILVVDDHAAARESVADVLRHAGYEVRCASSAREALGLLSKSEYHVIITDLQMPGMDGLEFIRQIQQRRLLSQIIMVTAHATIASAVEAMRYGAFDYLEKPFNATRLEELVGRAVERGRLLAPEESKHTSGTSKSDDQLGLVGNSRAMQALRASIRQVAPTDETVLIVGESGTGKELVARALHRLSRRNAGKLVSLNCPALSPQLTESELFGHRRGAYTGADDDRVGRFEMADKGTILLDEITEIDLPLQAKLLRVLQERTFERVGCSQSRTADVRILASTNRDLQQEVASARFRQDLYYRLAVVPLLLPPLREREGDVHMLTDYFLERAANRLQRPQCEMEQDARRLFADYHWPGNVRELENIVTRACVLNEGQPISAVEMQPWLEQPEFVTETSGSPLPVGVTLEEMERQMIVATLERFGGHRARTAEALGIGVRTLSGKLRGYGYAPHAKEFGLAPSVRQNSPNESANSAGFRTKQSA